MSEKKQALITAALAEFAAHSYDEASLNQIIKSSGTSKGTFYHYFEDKADLYIELLRQTAQEKWEFIQKELSAIDGKQETQDIFDLFTRQAILGMRFAKNFPKNHALSERFLKEADKPIYQTALQKLALDQQDLHDQVFQTAYEAGELNTRYSLEFIKNTTLYMFNHFDEIYSYSKSMEEKLEKLALLVDFLRTGFGKTS